MANLTARAESLLLELAKDHGVDRLEFDADGLIPMTIRDTLVAVAFSPANDSFFLTSVVQAPNDARSVDPWLSFQTSGQLAVRRTRLAVEPAARLSCWCAKSPWPGWHTGS